MGEEKPAPGIDGYESKYMAGGGAPVHREKMIWKLHWILLVWVPFLWVLAGMILAGMGSKPAPAAMALLPLAMSALFALLWAMFAVLRVHVTEREVHIQYGLFGPHIPVDAIDSCEVVGYEFSKFGGWGIRRAMDGTWAYSLMGDSDKVVEIRWTEGGKTKKVVVSSRDPARLVEQIRAVRAKASLSTGVRVAQAALRVASDQGPEPAQEEPAQAEPTSTRSAARKE
ncbi:MAG: hypothetical protein HY898_21845 [Deltaproteobacteria bacterium]|nr:hypothetical protein [Deltaproteobacteria bacterium]